MIPIIILVFYLFASLPFHIILFTFQLSKIFILKRFIHLILAGIITTGISFAQNDASSVFPDDYLGVYKGKLNINSDRGTQEITMEFHLKATDSIDTFEYILVYGEGDSRQQRNYTLRTLNKAKGEYLVDENNGILLDDKVVDNRMYALFEVQGTLLTTFITFKEDHIIFEIAAARRENARTTHAENEERTEVISYPVSTVQRAVLKRQ